MSDIEKRAIEHLAEAYRRRGQPGLASLIIERDGRTNSVWGDVALNAIVAALTPPEGWAAQHDRDSKELRKLCESRDFYKRRCEALQAVQSNMRDPERKAVCDILANGSTSELAARPEVP